MDGSGMLVAVCCRVMFRNHASSRVLTKSRWPHSSNLQHRPLVLQTGWRPAISRSSSPYNRCRPSSAFKEGMEMALSTETCESGTVVMATLYTASSPHAELAISICRRAPRFVPEQASRQATSQHLKPAVMFLGVAMFPGTRGGGCRRREEISRELSSRANRAAARLEQV